MDPAMTAAPRVLRPVKALDSIKKRLIKCEFAIEREQLFPLESKRIPFCSGENVPEETRSAMGYYADPKIVHHNTQRETFSLEKYF